MGKQSEVEWVEQVLVPLLHRLGFSRVEFTHGPLEMGRDLVVLHHDPFGLPRYYGIQVKLGNVSRPGTRRLSDLLDQLKLAYQTAHVEVATGTQHRISGVYLVATGRVSEKSKRALLAETGSWLHIIDGDQLDLLGRFELGRVTDAQRRDTLLRLRIAIDLDFLPLLQQVKLPRHRRSPEVSASFPPRPLPLESVVQAAEIAFAEFEPADLSALYQFRAAAESLNYLALKLPLGQSAGDATDTVLRHVADLVPFLLTMTAHVRGFVDYALGSPRPLPGGRLPAFPEPSPKPPPALVFEASGS